MEFQAQRYGRSSVVPHIKTPCEGSGEGVTPSERIRAQQAARQVRLDVELLVPNGNPDARVGQAQLLPGFTQHEQCTIRAEFQGELVKLTVEHPRGWRSGGGPRGPITRFSRGSRLRFLDLLKRLDWKRNKSTLITLSYHNEWPDPKQAKQHLRRFMRRLTRLVGKGVALIWRMGFQGRDAPHFHIIAFDVPFIRKDIILELWREITGDPTIDRTRIELVRNRWKVMNYITKLEETPEPSSGLVVVTYPSPLPTSRASVGRFWGIAGRAYLPLAEGIEEVITVTTEAFYAFKRYARRYWHGINRLSMAGFRLFVGNAERWLMLWHRCLSEAPPRLMSGRHRS